MDIVEKDTKLALTPVNMPVWYIVEKPAALTIVRRNVIF